jgi:hypothetical protein
MRYTPATIPETVSQVIARAWWLYLSTFLKVFLLALIIAVIAFIPKLILLGLHTKSFSLSPFNFKLIVAAVEIIDLSLFTAILWRLQCVTTHKHEKLQDDLLTAVKKVPLVIVAAILQNLLFFVLAVTALKSITIFNKSILGVLVAGLPIILASALCLALFVLFYFYLPLILTENKNPIRALQRSVQLVWGEWWRTFWTQLAPWLIYFVCIIVLKMLVNSLKPYLPAEVLIFFALVFYIGIFAMFIPWFAATMLIQLRDLELRKKISGPPKPRPAPAL